MIAISQMQLLTRSFIQLELRSSFFVRHRFSMVNTTSDDGDLG